MPTDCIGFIESALFVIRCVVQCRATNIISENIDEWHTEMRSNAQSHLCFPLCLMGFPQPRDGSPLQQWGGADETPGPVQRHARPNPQHLTPPQAHLPRGRTWDSAGLGMWIVTAVTCICSQSSESKTCWCCAFYLAWRFHKLSAQTLKDQVTFKSSEQQSKFANEDPLDLAPNGVALWLIIRWHSL